MGQPQYFFIFMDIRILNKTEFEASKELFSECFGEGKRFIEWYYRTRTKPEYVLGAFIKGELVSMLHMRPMIMRLAGSERSVCFVESVCTKPSFRRRGLCSAVFDAAFPIMRDRGFEATVLQPFSPSFYEQFGYKTFIYRQKITLSHERATVLIKRTTELHERTKKIDATYSVEKLAGLYADFMKGREGCGLRDEAYFKGFIEEFSSPDARLTANENGCCAGYAEGGEGVFTAYELFFRAGTDPVSLLPEGFEEYVFPLPMDIPAPKNCGVDIEEFSMIKPLAPSFAKELEEADSPNGRYYGFDKY